MRVLRMSVCVCVKTALPQICMYSLSPQLSLGHRFSSFDPHLETFLTFQYNIGLQFKIILFQIRVDAIVSENGRQQNFELQHCIFTTWKDQQRKTHLKQSQHTFISIIIGSFWNAKRHFTAAAVAAVGLVYSFNSFANSQCIIDSVLWVVKKMTVPKNVHVLTHSQHTGKLCARGPQKSVDLL